MSRKQRQVQAKNTVLQTYSHPLQMKSSDAQLLLEAINLHQAGNINEAQRIYRVLHTSYPTNATILHLLGIISARRGDLDEGINLYDKAIAIKPDYTEAYCDRGYALSQLARYDEALANYEQAIAYGPDHAQSHFNKGALKLLLGEFEEGWKLYEWRWKTENNSIRMFEKPLWLGKESLAGKTILLHAEQGSGDAIQMCRYIPHLEALGATVVLGLLTSLNGLVSILRRSFSTSLVIIEGDAAPSFDFHCPLFSLPLACGALLNTIPANIPYLSVDPDKRQVWKDRLGVKTKLRIGLVWSGATQHKNDKNRSISLDVLAPLFRDGAYEIHSLQKDYRQADASLLAQNNRIISHSEYLNDFDDTAALVYEMDIIISVDTAVAHLAGALGKPLWIMLPFSPDFRWLLDREDSPWYPTARLFRQPSIGNWESVIAEVLKELSIKIQNKEGRL